MERQQTGQLLSLRNSILLDALSEGRKRTAKVALAGYFLYIGGMFVLLQYSIFDFRIRNNPESLTIPTAAWPHIEAGHAFVNNFGLIKDKADDEFVDWLLPEHHIHVEVNSLKFEELNALSDPFTLKGKYRRIHFDDYGGVRLEIALTLRLKPSHSFQHLEDLIRELLKKRITIQAPKGKPRTVSLDNLTAPFKNLFGAAIVPKERQKLGKHLVRPQAFRLQLHLKQDEFGTLGELASFEPYKCSPSDFIWHKRIQIGGNNTDCLITTGINDSTNRFLRYSLGYLLGLEENMESILYFLRSKEVLKNEGPQKYKKLCNEYLEGQLYPNWAAVKDVKDIYGLYRRIAGKRFDVIKKDSHLLNTSNTISLPTTLKSADMENRIKELIGNWRLGEALDLMDSIANTSVLKKQILLLKARLSKYELDKLKKILTHEREEISFNSLVNDMLGVLNMITNQNPDIEGMRLDPSGLYKDDLLPERNKDLNAPKKIFFSYSKNDRTYLEELKKHLATLRRQGKVELWDDNEILPGDKWNNKIHSQLEAADIVLFLLSANMLATDYVWEEEIPLAMRLRKEGKLRVIPIVLKNCDWESTELGELNGLPRKGQPINTFEDHDTAWDMVVTEIRRIL